MGISYALTFYIFFLFPAVIGSSIVYVALRKHIELDKYYFLTLLVPWCIWFCLVTVDDSEKSLVNFFIESMWLGIFVLLLFAMTNILKYFNNIRSYSASKLVFWLSICSAVSFWWLFPYMPE